MQNVDKGYLSKWPGWLISMWCHMGEDDRLSGTECWCPLCTHCGRYQLSFSTQSPGRKHWSLLDSLLPTQPQQACVCIPEQSPPYCGSTHKGQGLQLTPAGAWATLIVFLPLIGAGFILESWWGFKISKMLRIPMFADTPVLPQNPCKIPLPGQQGELNTNLMTDWFSISLCLGNSRVVLDRLTWATLDLHAFSEHVIDTLSLPIKLMLNFLSQKTRTIGMKISEN